MRNCEYIRTPPLFQSRVSGVGGSLSPEVLQRLMAGEDLGIPGAVARTPSTLSDELVSQMFKATGGGTVTQKVLTPEEIAQQEEIIAKNRAAAEAEQKKIQNTIEAAKKWQTSTSIATVKVVRDDGSANGSVVYFDVYGYNKENGQLWVKDPIEGRLVLAHESVFKNSPEWQAAKASIGKSSGSALPLLLGAAYLLLS